MHSAHVQYKSSASAPSPITKPAPSVLLSLVGQSEEEEVSHLVRWIPPRPKVTPLALVVGALHCVL